MKINRIHDIVKNIDLKMSRLYRFAEKRNYTIKQRGELLKTGFINSCNLYGISEDDYLNHILYQMKNN